MGMYQWQLDGYSSVQEWQDAQDATDAAVISAENETDVMAGFDEFNPNTLAPSTYENASEMNAALVRQEWEDYKARFRPMENELLAKVNNPVERAQAVERARDSVSQGFANSKANLNQNLGQYGMTMTGAQKTSSDRRLKLSEAATKAGASNDTRQHIRDRDLNAIGGGMNIARTS